MGRIAAGLGLDAEVRVEEDAEEITAEFLGDDLGPLIGHHGAVIDAIQHLTYRIVFHGIDERKRISVDAAGYRERRAQTLGRSATKRRNLRLASSGRLR